MRIGPEDGQSRGQLGPGAGVGILARTVNRRSNQRQRLTVLGPGAETGPRCQQVGSFSSSSSSSSFVGAAVRVLRVRVLRRCGMCSAYVLLHIRYTRFTWTISNIPHVAILPCSVMTDCLRDRLTRRGGRKPATLVSICRSPSAYHRAACSRRIIDVVGRGKKPVLPVAEGSAGSPGFTADFNPREAEKARGGGGEGGAGGSPLRDDAAMCGVSSSRCNSSTHHQRGVGVGIRRRLYAIHGCACKPRP
jgi:hypothetical protein